MLRDTAVTLHLLNAARRSSRRPVEWFHRRQERVLKRLLRHAYDRVPLCKRLAIGALYISLITILACSMSWLFIRDIYPALKEGKSSSPLALSVNAKK